MAISKETALRKIEVLYNAQDPILQVFYLDKFDDPDDDQLPVQQPRAIMLTRYEADGTTATDYSGYQPEVIAVCDAVWPVGE